MIDLVQTEARAFWKIVTANGPAPEPLEWGDKRCDSCDWRWSCRELDDMYGDGVDVYDESLAPAALDYLEARELATAAKNEQDLKAAELKGLMGDRTEVRYGPDKGERLTFKTTDRKGYTVQPTRFRQMRVFGSKA
jgi:hypothetical protein